ncbi:MAG: sugar phosphate isomerase/epimerase [Armatimonadetes bacterium]|nr:sugar phosphate isomerase/epimerase [Armatimonadota bacterium]
MPSRPRISWLAVRHINPCMDEGRPTLEEIIEQAYVFGLRHIELYRGFFASRDAEYVRHIRDVLDRNELQVSQITCAPDFTHPDPSVREAEYAEMVEWVATARVLGSVGVRVTAGCVHEGVAREDAIRWAVEGLSRLGDHAEPLGVKLGFENHYRDKRWTSNDFCFHTAEFLDVFAGLRDTPVGVNFDASNQLMTGEDPLPVLEAVKHRVWHMHASDRRPGEYTHTVIGEGAVDFDALFRCLADIGYAGFISLEDGQTEGDAGTQRSLRFVKTKVLEHWR